MPAETTATTTTPPEAVTTPAGSTETTPNLDSALKVLFETVDGEGAPPSDAKPDERGLSLDQAIAEGESDIKKKKDEEDAKAKTGDATPPGTPPPAAPADGKPGETPPEKPVRVRRRVPAHTAPAPAAPEPVPATPPPAKPSEPKDELDGIELLPEEKDNLELAAFAEARHPEKYAGLASKMKKFIKAHADFVAAEQANDSEAVFDSSNPRYQAFIAKNKPALTQSEIRVLDRERIAEDTKKQIAPELDRLRDENFRRDAEPEIKREGDRFVQAVFNEAAPDFVREAFQKEGLAKAREKHAFEVEIIDQVVSAAANDMEELLRLTRINPETNRPLRAYDPANQQHERVLKIVRNICDDFKANGGKATVRDGKRFVTRDEYYNLSVERRAPYWTFTPEEVVRESGKLAKQIISNRIKAEEERLTKFGFRRQAAAPAAPAPISPGAPPAPRSPTTTPTPSAPEVESKPMSILFGS